MGRKIISEHLNGWAHKLNDPIWYFASKKRRRKTDTHTKIKIKTEKTDEVSYYYGDITNDERTVAWKVHIHTHIQLNWRKLSSKKPTAVVASNIRKEKKEREKKKHKNNKIQNTRHKPNDNQFTEAVNSSE